MPHAKHPSCKTPEDLTQKIWRYMDFTKFVAMLEEKALFFPNLASLIGDSLEGFFTKPTVEKFRKIPNGLDVKETERRRSIGEYNLGFMKRSRNMLSVSSWHMNNHESAAMWKLYLRSGEGVAIQSTVGRLIESLKESTCEVHIGMIEYVDYEKDEIPWDNVFSLATHKRKSFEHENELRAIILSPNNPSGLLLSVNLDIMIERIFVAPTCMVWVHDLLKKLVIKYGLNKEVVKSTLEQKPLY